MWQGLDMYGLICKSSVAVQTHMCRLKGAYATVSTVCSSPLFWCLVDLNVLDDQVASIEALGIGVCLCILEESEKKLSRLDGPASAGDTECLSYKKNSDQQSSLNIPSSVLHL